MKQIARLLAAALIATSMAACIKETPRPEPEPSPDNSNWPTAEQHDYSPADARKPRSIVCYNGKVYVSCGYPAAILRIDTIEGRIDRILSFDSKYDLEGIAVANGKIFVASSWTSTASGAIIYDNRIFVVDANTFNLTDVITVPDDPQRIVDVDGIHLLVSCGNGYNVPTNSVIIDVNTHSVTELGREITALDVHNGIVYTYSGGYTTPATFYRLNPLTNTTDTILANCGISYPYNINCIGDRIYVTTQDILGGAGDVVCFASDGTQLWSSEAGMLPSKVVPLGDGTAYVLNEGNWSSNEASLSRINLTTGAITNNIFSTVNGRDLGDVAQDLVVYGTKAYVTVSFSNTVEVVSIIDNTSRQIQL